MALTSDAEFRRGLAASLGGIGAILLGIDFGVTAPAFSTSGWGSGLAFLGLGIGIAGAVTGALGVVQMERTASHEDP